MKKQIRRERFVTPSAAWVIVEGPGKGKRLNAFADEERNKRVKKSTDKEQPPENR